MFDAIRQEFPLLRFRRDVPYRELTTLGCGGTLPLLLEAGSEEELNRLLAFLHRRHTPVLVLGRGSNLAGMDAVFPGVGLRLAPEFFSRFEVRGNRLRAGAEITVFVELARRAAEAGLGGFAALAGIPGTLGGALRMNAGAQGTAISDFLLELDGVRLDGTPYHAAKDELEWGYRTSSLPADVIVTSARFELPAADPAAEMAKIKGVIEARRAREPKGRTAGCAFRNAGSEPAGKLIDRCGLKGCRRGAFLVSEEHANYIVNTDPAGGREADLLDLMAHLRQQVTAATGIYLEPEIVFVNPDATARMHAGAPPPRVAVAMGGCDSEREVSLRSGAAVAAALRRIGCQVREVDLDRCEIRAEMTAADAVIPMLHGGFGEDGRLQKLMEDERIAFSGSASDACALVMDKIATKKKLDELGLPTAKWAVVTPAAPAFPADLSLPAVLKAPCEGSTIGIEIVRSTEEYAPALDRVFRHDRERVLVEEFIDGIEATVPVLFGRAFPAVEIRSPHGFYDYDAKYVYKDGKTEYFCPAQSLTPAQSAELQRQAECFYREFGCRDLVRVDFMIDRAGRPFILEGNALPGFTATSLVPKSALTAGWSFEYLVAQLLKAALERRTEVMV